MFLFHFISSFTYDLLTWKKFPRIYKHLSEFSGTQFMAILQRSLTNRSIIHLNHLFYLHLRNMGPFWRIFLFWRQFQTSLLQSSSEKPLSPISIGSHRFQTINSCENSINWRLYDSSDIYSILFHDYYYYYSEFILIRRYFQYYFQYVPLDCLCF